MTPRQETILKNLVEAHLKSSRAIGSKFLSKSLSLSPAAIRLELKILVKGGYLETVRNFVGRIPSDKGWRHFVDEIDDADYFDYPPAGRKKALNNKKVFALVSHMARHLNLLSVSFFEEFRPQIFSTGFAPLFKNYEFGERFVTDSFLHDMEFLEKNIYGAFDLIKNNRVKIMIGKENSLLPSGLFSSALAGDRKNGWIISFTGPKRMPYQQTVAFLKDISNLLNK